MTDQSVPFSGADFEMGLKTPSKWTLNYDYLVTYIVPKVKNHAIIFTNNTMIYCIIQMHKDNEIHSTHNDMKTINEKETIICYYYYHNTFLFLVPYIRQFSPAKGHRSNCHYLIN